MLEPGTAVRTNAGRYGIVLRAEMITKLSGKIAGYRVALGAKVWLLHETEIEPI